MTSPHDYLHDYLAARGLVIRDPWNARKVAEEAIELVEECARETPDPERVMHEVADVVFAAAVIAEHHGFTLEQAMEAKIALDTGRNRQA